MDGQDGRVERRTRTEGTPIKGQSLSINMKNYLSVSLLMTHTHTHTGVHVCSNRNRLTCRGAVMGSSVGLTGI